MEARMTAKMEAKIDSSQEKMDAIEHKMLAKMETTQHRIKAHHEEMMAKMDAWRGVTPACPEKEEPAPEEPKAVAETEEVPEGAIGVTEDRSRNLRLAVGCRGRLKTRTKGDGRVRQVYAATIGRPTRRSVPAMRKGGLRRGPGKKCRRGSKGQNKAFRIGKRKMIGKQRRRLERRRTFYEAVEPTLGPEVINLVVESSIGLREPGAGYCGSVGPHRSGRGSAIAAPREAAAMNNGGGRYSERERESRGATAGENVSQKRSEREQSTELESLEFGSYDNCGIV
jgi:hypothetical protein